MNKKPFHILVVAFALTILASRVDAVPMVPVMISLDNPNQIVMAPSTGVTMVDFSGTVIVDPNYLITLAGIPFAENSANTNSLASNFSSAFSTFLSVGSGTFTGSIFQIAVPAGTPADLYAYSSFPNLSELGLEVTNRQNSEDTAQAFAPFSCQVIGNGVPEGGSTALLLSVVIAGLGLVHRRLTF